jgi:hypothetical protein
MIKTDNHNLAAKLELRRQFLQDFPKGKRLSVVDCFSGERESIWSQLRKEFNVGEYLALDIKEKKNRLKIDSLRYLQNQKWEHDVVDLDCYGSPWQHWFEVLRKGKSLTVFLTLGQAGWHMKKLDTLRACGITFKIPNRFHRDLDSFTTDCCLSACLDKFTVEKALEAENPHGNARYFGVRIVLKRSVESGKIKASENKNKNTKKEPK